MKIQREYMLLINAFSIYHVGYFGCFHPRFLIVRSTSVAIMGFLAVADILILCAWYHMLIEPFSHITLKSVWDNAQILGTPQLGLTSVMASLFAVVNYIWQITKRNGQHFNFPLGAIECLVFLWTTYGLNLRDDDVEVIEESRRLKNVASSSNLHQFFPREYSQLPSILNGRKRLRTLHFQETVRSRVCRYRTFAFLPAID
jgi:hypothetical protein